MIERLRDGGHEVAVTAREYGQTEGLLDRLGIPYTSVGRHGGGRMVAKGGALASRSARLWGWARGRGFDLALAHGSVDIAVVSRALRIPLAQMNDYEHAGLQRRIAFRSARLVMAPDAIPVEAMERAGARAERLFRYPGLKEDYYLADFRPDPRVIAELGLDKLGFRVPGGDVETAQQAAPVGPDPVLVVIRPPPETSEYHTENPVYEDVIDRLGGAADSVAVAIPRTAHQARRLRDRGMPSLVVPDRAVDAQSLIAYSDLVVSAGGTMNREAVALGTPVYTIFSGRMGAVDERLIADGRLRELFDAGQIELVKREAGTGPVSPRDPQLLVDAALAAAR